MNCRRKMCILNLYKQCSYLHILLNKFHILHLLYYRPSRHTYYNLFSLKLSKQCKLYHLHQQELEYLFHTLSYLKLHKSRLPNHRSHKLKLSTHMHLLLYNLGLAAWSIQAERRQPEILSPFKYRINSIQTHLIVKKRKLIHTICYFGSTLRPIR